MRRNLNSHTFWVFISVVILGFSGSAQDSLNAITVSSHRLEQNILVQDSRVDTIRVNNAVATSLADVLANESSVYIRSFGPGLASTISKQGFSPSQSVVYWNGIPLNSPSLGLTDASMIPVDGVLLMDNGAGTGLYGSGYMGGGIHLNTSTNVPNGLSFLQQNQYMTSGLTTNTSTLSYKSEHFQHSASFNKQWGRYNYTYIDLYGDERERIGADQDVNHLRYEGEWKSDRNQLEWGVWGTKMDRGIPRSISEIYAEGAQQLDDLIRSYVGYSREWEKWTLHSQVGFYGESQIYLSDVVQDTNLANALYVQSDLSYRPTSSLKLFLAADYNLQNGAGTSKLDGRIERLGSALTADYHFLKYWTFNTSVRVENQGDLTPVLPSALLRFTNSGIEAQVSYREYFRFPTLNDLFWSPGGNPNLNPEQGKTWSIDASYSIPSPLEIQLKASAFTAQIDEYILWVPNGQFYSPMNVKQVNSNGGTVGLKVGGKVLSSLYWNIHGEYSLTNAKTVESERQDDPSLNQQLIYTPQHKSTAGISLEWCQFQLWGRATYNGYTHTTTDNNINLALLPFTTIDVGVGYPFALSNFTITANAGIMNLTDEAYSFQRYYPMPGIQGTFSLTFQFKNS